jgi:hypothetical protein
MNLNTLTQFRQALYQALRHAKDALFEACDALVSDCTAQSFAELSLSPRWRRRWCSLYAAFRDGRIDRAALRATFATQTPIPSAGQRLVIGVDVSTVARPESPTARDRTYQYVHNLPDCRAPVTVGWGFSAVVVLPETPSSWTYLLDNQRVPSECTAAQVAAEQLAALVPLFPSGRCYWVIGITAAPPLCRRRRRSRVTNFCGFPATASSIVRPRHGPGNAVRPAKMGRRSNVVMRVRTVSRRPLGKASMTRGTDLKWRRGPTCITSNAAKSP